MINKNYIFLMFGIFFLVYSLNLVSSTSSLTTGLNAYYKIDEPSGTLIRDSLDRFNGTTFGAGIILNTPGKINKSAFFSTGTNSINISTNVLNVSLNSDDYTFNFWENTTVPNKLFLQKILGVANNYTNMGTNASGNPYFHLNSGSSGCSDPTAYAPSINASNGTIMMLTGVRTARNSTHQYLYMYVNGVLYGNTTTPNCNVSNTGEFKLGLNSFREGILDGVGIWGRALTQTEITDLFNINNGNDYPFEPISITINAIQDNVTLISGVSTLFNWTNTVTVGTLVNTTIWINGVLNETINISGTSNTTSTSKTFSTNGLYNWSITTCSTISCSNSTNYFFNVSEMVNNSITYDGLVYDTQKKSIWINISTSPSVSSITANLEYNNTNYTMTNSGTVNSALFNVTFDLPNVNAITNKTFRIYVSYSSTQTGANTRTIGDYNQSINATILTLCNVSYATGYLNLSFKDETNSTVLNAAITSATFDYYLGDGTTYKTLTFSNTSNNYYYAFCSSATNNILNIDPFVQYKQGTSYPQRTWNPTATSYANTTTNQTLYLLSSATGIYSTIQVQDITENALSGVTVSAESYVGGVWILIGSGTTGSDGGVTFWLNPDSQARINASKTGYDSVSTTITPTQDGYTITLGGGTSAAAFDYSKGIIYYIQPTVGSLVNDTSYTFSFYISSSYWNLTYYYFNVTNEDGITYGSNYGTTSSGSNITRSINTGTNQSFCINYYWTANSTNSTSSRCWIIFDTSQNRFSLYNLFSDLTTYITSGLYGLDNFGVGLLCFLVVVMITGTLKMKWGISDESVLIGVVFGVVSLLDVGFNLIPNPLNAVPHFATVIMALIFVSFLYKEVFQ